MEQQLLRSERLGGIGEVAAMVGHDLRNPLTGIAGAAYYLKTRLGSKKDKKTKEMIGFIEKDIEYSNNIINDLLEYSREIRLELIETTPKALIREALSVVKFPPNINVSDSTMNKPKIVIDLEKMKRVFVNLIKNAVEAMHNGGTLTITSRTSDGNIEIGVADTGVGMPKEVLDKLWTPLFTTKAKGMGLGLSICKRIVDEHAGIISVESTVGEGTTFTVAIPKLKLEGGENLWEDPQKSSL
jgi:signal transduction histidine kinase